MEPMRVEQVIEQVGISLAAQLREAQQQVHVLRAAVDAYEAAIESDLAGSFAVRNGIVAELGPRAAVRAAVNLRDAVTAVPELRAQPADDLAPDIAVAPIIASPAPAPQTTTQRTPRDPASIALQREVELVEFDSLRDDVFAKYVEEFAARARAIQERAGIVGPTDEYESRLIRRLTALVRERGTVWVHGLRLQDSGDWEWLARRAHEKRQRLESVGDAARPLVRKVLTADVAAKIATSCSPDDEGDDEHTETPDVPLDLQSLRAAAERGSIVLIGGVKPSMIERARRCSGVELEWIAIPPHASAPTTATVRRIREGRVAGLVLLEALMGHKDQTPLLEAARTTETPFAYAGRGGTAALARAFRDLDAMLERAAEDVAKTG